LNPQHKTSASTFETRLPVLIWIQGGAFVQLFNPNYNGTGIIEASDNETIVVSFNYRVGPYGFLANEELKKENNLNVGFYDQRFALTWVQKYIGAFGGDPNRVTLFGTSVGAGSILLHTVAYGGSPPENDTAHWNAGIAPAAYLPSVYTIPDLQYQSDAILAATNCTDLRCLRSLSSEVIQDANTAIPFPGQSTVALFPYAPVIDDQAFPDHPQALLRQGKFSRERSLIIGSSHSEGTLFAPQANNTADIHAFLKQQFPKLTNSDIQDALSHYSTVPTTIPGVNASNSALFFEAAEIYGDASFNCPTQHFAAALSEADVDVYYLRNHIVDPIEFAAGYLVPHTWEVQAVWGPEYAINYVALPGATSYNNGGINRQAVSEVQNFWIQFAKSGGDPNHPTTAEDTLIWHQFSDENQRLKLQTNATTMEKLSRTELDRCAFWSNISSRTLI
jgi:acetylcholinesterase